MILRPTHERLMRGDVLLFSRLCSRFVAGEVTGDLRGAHAVEDHAGIVARLVDEIVDGDAPAAEEVKCHPSPRSR